MFKNFGYEKKNYAHLKFAIKNFGKGKKLLCVEIIANNKEIYKKVPILTNEWFKNNYAIQP